MIPKPFIFLFLRNAGKESIYMKRYSKNFCNARVKADKFTEKKKEEKPAMMEVAVEDLQKLVNQVAYLDITILLDLHNIDIYADELITLCKGISSGDIKDENEEHIKFYDLVKPYTEPEINTFLDKENRKKTFITTNFILTFFEKTDFSYIHKTYKNGKKSIPLSLDI